MPSRTTVDEYMASLPDDRRFVMQRIRETIRRAAPNAEERISYGMPSFWQGTTLIWYAAANDHIGIYPTASGVAEFADRLVGYSVSRGTIRIPWDQPIPYDLITDIVAFRMRGIWWA